MAGFKTQIKDRFKAKWPNVNLTNTRLNAIVDKLDLKIETEDAIDAKLDELDEIIPFSEIAKQDDRVRDLEAKNKGGKTPEQIAAEKKAAEDAAAAAGGAQEGDEVPAWAKGLTDTIQKLSGELTAIKGEKTIAGRKATLTEKLKDAPESFRNEILADVEEMNFRDEDHFNSYVERKATAAAALIQEQSNAGLGKDKPASNFGKPTAEKEVSAEMKQYLAENAPKAAATT